MSKKSIGLKVKSYLIINEIKQEDFAKELNITRQSLNNKLNGKTSFTFDELSLICQKFNVEIGEFFR